MPTKSVKSTEADTATGDAQANDETRRGSSDVTHEAIARRAYEIHTSGEGGSDVEDWLRSERELLTRV
jgi:hypothetical protein